MKKKWIGLVILVLIMFSCEPIESRRSERLTEEQKERYLNEDNIKIVYKSVYLTVCEITIDSCEYIYDKEYDLSVGASLTHKGNCKYCQQRKEIEK